MYSPKNLGFTKNYSKVPLYFPGSADSETMNEEIITLKGGVTKYNEPVTVTDVFI